MCERERRGGGEDDTQRAKLRPKQGDDTQRAKHALWAEIEKVMDTDEVLSDINIVGTAVELWWEPWLEQLRALIMCHDPFLFSESPVAYCLLFRILCSLSALSHTSPGLYRCQNGAVFLPVASAVYDGVANVLDHSRGQCCAAKKTDKVTLRCDLLSN